MGEGNELKSDAMKGSAPEIIVRSSACTENGRISPAMSRSRYFFIARFSSMHIEHAVVVPVVTISSEFWSPSACMPIIDSSSGAWEI